MITSKENLYGIVIEIKSSEDADFIAELCARFGIELGYWSGCKFNDGSVCAKISHNNGAHGGYLVFSNSIKERAGDMSEFKNLKRLTLSDLKPRTKVDYELIKFESTAGAYRAMLDGEKLYSQDGESEFIFDGKNFVGIDIDGGVYTLECHSNNEPFFRKVERPVEWWEDAKDFVRENACNMNAIARNLADDGLYVEAKMTRDQWCDFARILLEQEDENQNNASS